MIYKFNAYGHQNVLGTHKTTLEFTKEKEVSLKGDCIVGVNADFELSRLKEFIRKSIKNNNKKITITIKTILQNKQFQETILAEIDPNFEDAKELVIRKTNFVSERTFAIKADKAAFDLNRNLIRFLRGKKNRINVIIKNKE